MNEEQHTNTYISCIECAMLNEFQPCESCHNSQGQQLQFTPRYEEEIIWCYLN